VSTVMTELKIRAMKPRDKEAVVAIENDVFSDPWPDFAFDRKNNDPNHKFIVAQSDKKIVGYAAYFVDLGEARLTNIAVASDCRRKSIAKSLLNYILDSVKKADCRFIFLDVRPTNKAAIDLYRKYGFEDAYIRPGYYDNPREDAIVMMKSLEN